MSRVAVLGEREAVLGFRPSGAVVFLADTTERARTALEEILREDYAILLITEKAASALSAELGPLYERPKPVVTLLPDPRRRRGMGMEILRRRVERAVGANILFNGEE